MTRWNVQGEHNGICSCFTNEAAEHWRICAVTRNRIADYGAYLFCALHHGAAHPEVPGPDGEVCRPWGVLLHARDLLLQANRPLSMENSTAMQPAIDVYLDLCDCWSIEPEACSWDQRSPVVAA